MAIAYGNTKNTLTSNGLIVNLDSANTSSYNPTQNLVLHSNDVTNSAWDRTTFPVTIVNNATTNPFGSNTAFSATANAATSLYFQTIATSITGTGRLFASVYAKANTATRFTLNVYYNLDTEVNVTFDLTGNGSLTTDMYHQNESKLNHSIERVGTDGWFRCTIEVPARVGAGTALLFRIWPAGRSVSSGGCFFFGHQLRHSGGRSLDTYVQTTSSVANLPTTWTNLAGASFNANLNSVTYDHNNGKSIRLANSSGGGVSVNSFIEIPNAGVNPMSQTELTVEIVCKLDSTDFVWERVFDFGRGGNNSGAGVQAMIFAKPGAEWDWAIGTNGTLSQYINNFIPTSQGSYIRFGRWEHFCITWRNGDQRFYRNGELVSTSAANHTTRMSFEAFGATPTGDRFLIGKSNWNDGGWNGNFALFKIYNTVLTAAEIEQNCAITMARFGV